MPDRGVRTPTVGVVTRVEPLTPHMVRVVVGGPGLAGLNAGAFTDHYVKVLFPPAGGTFPEPFDFVTIRENLPREQWPVTRTYTVRRWLPDVPELWLDFVVHGDAGRFTGPGGAYAPDPTADWHLLVGDESALPAIAATLEGLPPAARVTAFIEVSDESEVQKLESPGDATIAWLYRGARPVGASLVDAVRGLEFPPGRVHAFVHGEATFVKELRRHLRHDRGIPRAQLSISGYWRLGLDEDGWQSSKREWNQQVEREQEA
jgi:NADPH-dependent ferric siderophore reductase